MCCLAINIAYNGINIENIFLCEKLLKCIKIGNYKGRIICWWLKYRKLKI